MKEQKRKDLALTPSEKEKDGMDILFVNPKNKKENVIMPKCDYFLGDKTSEEVLQWQNLKILEDEDLLDNDIIPPPVTIYNKKTNELLEVQALDVEEITFVDGESDVIGNGGVSDTDSNPYIYGRRRAKVVIKAQDNFSKDFTTHRVIEYYIGVQKELEDGDNSYISADRYNSSDEEYSDLLNLNDETYYIDKFDIGAPMGSCERNPEWCRLVKNKIK